VTTFGQLGRLLRVTPAVITNWKARGVSKDGAIAAEKILGCQAHWLLNGGSSFEAQTTATKVVAKAPALPPRNFADRREVTDSGWDVLKDLEDMPSSENAALRAEIHQRAESYRTFMRETIERMRQAKETKKS
jgi:hypothetical protein